MIVFIEHCQRRIPVTFAKRVVGRRMYGGQSTYIPMKLNTGGVVPIIFAASVLYFPILISNVFPSTGWGKDVQTWISTHLAQPSNLVYISLYGVLILVFAYFYAGITFDPHQQAEVIRKQGGYIPGIRPGYPTERHLQNILYRITLPGRPVPGPGGLAALHLPGHLEHPELPLRRHDPAHRRRRGLADHAAGGQPAHVAQLRGLPAVSCPRRRRVPIAPLAPLVAGPGRHPGVARPNPDGTARIVVLGRQGSGKGTQAARLSAIYGAPHISTGDAFRAAAGSGSELGQQAQGLHGPR